MKNFFVFVVVLFFAYVCSSSAQNCTNPLFRGCGGLLCNLTHLTTPVPRTTVDICPDIGTGGQTCCDDSTYALIKQQWAIAHQHVQDSVAAYKNATQSAQDILDNFGTYIDEIDQQYPELSQAQRDQIKNILYQVRDATESLLSNGLGLWVNCANGILSYIAGLVCFSCNPNWSNYMVYNSSSINVYRSWYKLYVDQNSCDQLSNDCTPFFQAFDGFLNSIDGITSQIDAITNTSSPFSSNTNSSDSICGVDCKSFICYNFAGGSSFSNPFGDSSNSFGNRRRSIQGNRLSNTVKTVFSAALEAFKNINEVEEEDSATTTKQRSNSNTGTSSNVQILFTNSNGYTAYTNGKSSNLDTGVSSAGAMWSWLKWFL